ncbi:MAG TPA: FCD domain-containing protein [Burkholderiaceae bacterium]|nr:FCD domain-containing protein [Burkholderiaceae bacterium]
MHVPSSAPPSAATQTDKAYSALHAAIVRCEFAPGARLRVEELGQRFGVSSSPLREALSRLVAIGLVDAFEHRGFRVAPLTVQGMADLTRVRLLIEGEALRDALVHGDDRWEAGLVAAAHALGRVEQRLADIAPALDDTWSARHRDFHMAVYAGAHSPLLQALVGQLFDAAERYRRFSARHRRLPRAKHSEHQRLLDAIIARDAERASALLVRHITSTERSVTAALLAMDAGALQ